MLPAEYLIMRNHNLPAGIVCPIPLYITAGQKGMVIGMEKKTFLYISCWDNLGGAPGLGTFCFDNETGAIRPVSVIREDLSCGFSFVDKDKKILYVCIETENHPDYFQGGGGRLFAFKINEEDGTLSEFSSARTFCPNPCYMSLDPSGKFMAVANHSAYNASTKIVLGEDGEYRCEMVFDDSVVEVFQINGDGSFGKLLDVNYHDKPAKGRAQHSHPQSAVMAPSGSFFVCTDVAEHCIYTYRIAPETGKLTVLSVYKDTPKSKPRYCVFHPTLPLLYVNYEGQAVLQVFRYTEDGVLTPEASVCAVPEGLDYPEGKGQSGLLVHPSGEYIYGLLNASASVAVFHLDKATGLPELVQCVSSVREKKLRAIGLSPDGAFLVTTCLQSGGIDVYAVGADGRLTATDHHAELKGAAFATFFQV